MQYQLYIIGIFLFKLSIIVNGQYYLYADDCLDYYTNEDIRTHLYTEPNYRKEHQIIPFCRSDYTNDESIIDDNTISSFTFDQLNKRDITSLQLYEWSSHLDLVEEYEVFRQNRNFSLDNISLPVFYNCSSQKKFGLSCQYSFNSTERFEKIVVNVLETSSSMISNGTCYVHLTCMRNNFSWCLDWGEVCDGKVDCWPDPVDEEDCNQMELNECGVNEYRCRNGQCIPQSFYLDNGFSPDCSDRSDEAFHYDNDYPYSCKNGDPAFRCVDIKCYHWFDTLCFGQYCGGAGSCRNLHKERFDHSIFIRSSNYHVNDECWATMLCLLGAFTTISISDPAHAHLFNGSCRNVCSGTFSSCSPRIRQHCPPLFEFPALPIGWSQFHLVFSWQETDVSNKTPFYICYDARFCGASISNIHFTKLSEPYRNLSCELEYLENFFRSWNLATEVLQRKANQKCSSVADGMTNGCPHATHFQCGNKCLSKHRLVDSFSDCPEDMDERYNDSCALNYKNRRICTVTIDRIHATQCKPTINIPFGFPKKCDIASKVPHFPTLCDGYVDYTEKIDGVIETDETNCEKWQCNNQYTRCDGLWNCRNGADEAWCFHPVCNGSYGYPCILANTTELICLPVSNANDGKIDCLGATDERHLCKESSYNALGYRCLTNHTNNEQIINNQEVCISYREVCNHDAHCLLDDDELPSLCQDGMEFGNMCAKFWAGPRQVTKKNIFCTLDDFLRLNPMNVYLSTNPHFSLANFSIRPPLSFVKSQSTSMIVKPNITEHLEVMVFSHQQQHQTSLHKFHCHGGITLYLKNDSKCLCPPAFYGLRCEYQNQRVSITLQIGTVESQSPFVLVVYLFDNINHVIDSYHYIRYLSIRDCSTKFNFYLLYSSQPKPVDRIYSIRIDAFEMTTLKYRSSWLFPILFPFLPVYRLSVQVTIPFSRLPSYISCPIHCPPTNGRCTTFANNGKFFCQCYPNWSGPTCTHAHKHNCSPDSICIGTSKNRSICVCPTHKFGQRCYLSNDFCRQFQRKICRNGGQCIPRDYRIPVDSPTVCSCPDRFYGVECEYNATEINILVSVSNLHEFLLIHFITVRSHMASIPFFPTDKWGPHERATTFKKIPLDHNLITIYWPQLFNILFAEYNGYMYLLLVQSKSTLSKRYNVSIESSQRCLSIRELLNDTIVNFPYLRRVKYYHIPCQERIDLGCFHDEDQFMCLCTYDRRANCFTFDHHMRYNCSELSYCENGGQCFQNSANCPVSITCACPKCFLGSRCQISSRGFGLSLDLIIGYQIRLGLSFSDQFISIKISGIVTVIMSVIGLINGILSILTFKQKALCEVGCGIYLLAASITSILTMIIFALKYIFLIAIQLSMMTNITFVKGHCFIIDFLLKVFLQIGEWLLACVASERLMSAIIGPKFKKRLSRKVARWMIFFIYIFVIGSTIQEPLHRTLIKDEDEGHIWCIVRYSESYSVFLTQYTIIMSIIHFIGPFVINIISAFGIITVIAKYRSKTKDKLSYPIHFYEQFQRHKYLIISPFILIILALPRIIFAFVLDCMKSAREPVTLYLIGYFISYVPPILLFAVFILPSSVYMKEFKRSVGIERFFGRN